MLFHIAMFLDALFEVVSFTVVKLPPTYNKPVLSSTNALHAGVPPVIPLLDDILIPICENWFEFKFHTATPFVLCCTVLESIDCVNEPPMYNNRFVLSNDSAFTAPFVPFTAVDIAPSANHWLFEISQPAT